MPDRIGRGGRPSSARGSNLRLHPRVEDGSTRAPMTPRARRALPCDARDPAEPTRRRCACSPCVSIVAVLLSVVFTEPRPALTATGSPILLALLAFVGGLCGEPAVAATRPTAAARRPRARRRRRASRSTALQPDGAGLRRRLLRRGRRRPRACRAHRRSPSAPRRWPARSSRSALTRDVAAAHDQRPPVLRRAVVLRDAARCASCATAATAPRRSSRSCGSRAPRRPRRRALAERGRVARDMHDVLAHSLSALALQLEGARLLAARPRRRPRGRGRDRARAPPRRRRARRGAGRDRRAARRRAARARAAARARRRLRRPLRADRHRRAARARAPRRGSRSTARPRRRCTNVRRHSAADRVELRLAYEPDGTRLVVAGPRARRARCRGRPERRRRLRPDRHARARRAARRPPRRRPDARTASASSCGCRRDPRPARRRPARRARGPRHAARPARRHRARRHGGRRRGGGRARPPPRPRRRADGPADAARATASRRSAGSPSAASGRARSR